MGEDKELHGRGQAAQNAEPEGAAPSRARNKTVMLSPEMTGQVRAMLNDAPGGSSGANPQVGGKQSLDDYLPPLVDWGNVGKGGVPAAAAPQEGFVRARGAPDGFSALDALADSQAGSAFDPLTSVAPSVTSRDAGSSPFDHKFMSGDAGGFSLNQPPSRPAVQTPLQAPPQSFQASQQAQMQAATAASFQQPAVQQAPAPVSQPAPAAPVAQARAPQPAAPGNWHAVVSNGKGDPSKLVGLLVSYDKVESGEIFEVRSGRFLITSRPTDNGDYLLVEDDSVSPLHAIVRATKEGSIQVLDQLSEFGTGVTRGGSGEEEEISGGLATIVHGDFVRFGKRTFVVVAIPQTRPPKAV